MDLTVSPSEETLLIASSDLALTTFNLANCDVANADDSKRFEASRDVVPCSGVLALDTCARKPLIATVGSLDHLLKVWDYEGRTCEVLVKFREPPTRRRLHPSGLYVLVVFPSQAKPWLCSRTKLRTLPRSKATGHLTCLCSRGRPLLSR